MTNKVVDNGGGSRGKAKYLLSRLRVGDIVKMPGFTEEGLLEVDAIDHKRVRLRAVSPRSSGGFRYWTWRIDDALYMFEEFGAELYMTALD